MTTYVENYIDDLYNYERINDKTHAWLNLIAKRESYMSECWGELPEYVWIYLIDLVSEYNDIENLFENAWDIDYIYDNMKINGDYGDVADLSEEYQNEQWLSENTIWYDEEHYIASL